MRCVELPIHIRYTFVHKEMQTHLTDTPPPIINKYVTHIVRKRTRTLECPQFPHQSDIKQRSEGSQPELLIWLNGCHSGTHVSHLFPSANSHLSLSLIIHLIWRPSAWLIRTFPEFHLFSAGGISAFLLLVRMSALAAHIST